MLYMAEGYCESSSQNVTVLRIGLTVQLLLMYPTWVGRFVSPFISIHGRLLKLVDRTDLGSVGDEP